MWLQQWLSKWEAGPPKESKANEHGLNYLKKKDDRTNLTLRYVFFSILLLILSFLLFTVYVFISHNMIISLSQRDGVNFPLFYWTTQKKVRVKKILEKIILNPKKIHVFMLYLKQY